MPLTISSLYHLYIISISSLDISCLLVYVLVCSSLCKHSTEGFSKTEGMWHILRTLWYCITKDWQGIWSVSYGPSKSCKVKTECLQSSENNCALASNTASSLNMSEQSTQASLKYLANPGTPVFQCFPDLTKFQSLVAHTGSFEMTLRLAPEPYWWTCTEGLVIGTNPKESAAKISQMCGSSSSHRPGQIASHSTPVHRTRFQSDLFHHLGNEANSQEPGGILRIWGLFKIMVSQNCPYAALSRPFRHCSKNTRPYICECHSDTKSLAWVLERLPYETYWNLLFKHRVIMLWQKMSYCLLWATNI